MARARSGGGAGAAWALVLLGAGFIICLILAVLFSVQLGEARERREEAVAELDRYVGSAQRQSQVVQNLLQAGDGTVVGQLLQTNEALRGLIGVSPDATLDAVRQRVAGVAGEDAASLLQEVETLSAELDALQDRLAQQREDLEQARNALSTAQEEQAALREQFNQARRQLASGYQSGVTTAESEVATLRENLGGLEEQLRQVRSDMRGRVDNLQTQVASLEAENQRLQNQLARREREAGLEASPVTRPDGEIASVLSDSELVYLNRGRQDQVLLGLTFEVFEKGKPIELDEAGEVRGKATVQVVEINRSSSLARVVRQPQTGMIREGDSIVNIVYDAEQTPAFTVFGAFNLNGEGEASFDEQDSLEDIVRRWGGEVHDELSYDTDFLLLGEEPEAPDPLPQDVIDPERIAEYNERQRIYDNYQALAQRAEELRIPILNQNRFLTLIGYYQR